MIPRFTAKQVKPPIDHKGEKKNTVTKLQTTVYSLLIYMTYHEKNAKELTRFGQVHLQNPIGLQLYYAPGFHSKNTQKKLSFKRIQATDVWQF